MVVLLFFILLVARLVVSDPFVSNYTMGTSMQQDRFLLDVCPSLSDYESGTATGELLWVNSGGCEITEFSAVVIKFVNNFNGGILIRGNTPFEVQSGIPKFRDNFLTTSLGVGGEASVSVNFDHRLFKGENGVLVYDFVFAKNGSGVAPLIGNLMVIAETYDRSLCMLHKVAYDNVQLVEISPFDTFNVREKRLESPLSVAQFIRADQSNFPLIGPDYYQAGVLWGLALTYKNQQGLPQGLVRFKAYEANTNIRIIALGMGQGILQGLPRLDVATNLVYTGSIYRYDGMRWYLSKGQSNDEPQPHDRFAIYDPRDNVKYNFNDMPQQAPFLVFDVSANLDNRQTQIVLTELTAGMKGLC